MIVRGEHRVPILELVNVMFIQSVLKNLAGFLWLPLNHQYYAQDIVRLEGVTKFVRKFIQTLYHLLAAI